MSSLYRWTAWNLTPDGWQRNGASDSAVEVARYRPANTLLALLSMRRVDDPEPGSLVSVLYRSPNIDAVADAMAKHGPKPAD